MPQSMRFLCSFPVSRLLIPVPTFITCEEVFMFKFKIFFFTALLAIGPAVFAQEEISLEDVVVSAYKSNITYGQSSSVSIITSKDIEAGGYRFVSDVLQTVPGLTLVQNGTLGGTASVFIRGAKTGNVVVLVDGVKINDPSTIERSVDFATLTTDSIERIEIIKGPQSGLYGSDATGGIINIVTKRGQGKPSVTLTAKAGSYFFNQQSAHINGGDSSFNYSITAGQIASKGLSKAAKPYDRMIPMDNDPFYQRYGIVKFGFSPLSVLSVDAGFTAKHSSFSVDDGAFIDDPTNTEKRTEYTGYTQIHHTLTDYWTHSITVNSSSIKRVYYDIDDDGYTGWNDFAVNNRYKGSQYSVEWLHTFTIKNISTLNAGISYEKEKFTYHDYLFYASYTPTLPSQSNEMATTGYFIQDHLSIASIVFITANARIDNNSFLGKKYSYSVSPSITIPVINTKIKANYGKGFKFPSLYQIYGDGGTYTLPNPKLQSETNTSYDYGIEQPIFKIITCSLTYFTSKYHNMIDYNSKLLSKGFYYNINKVKTYGYESSLTIQPIEQLKLTGGYTYCRAIDQSNDKQLNRRPKHYGFGQATVMIKNFQLSLMAQFAGKRKDSYYDPYVYSNVNVIMDKYIKYDVNIAYTIMPQLTVTAKVENLTNTNYQYTYGYTTPSRSFYAGVEVVLQ